MAVRDTSVQSYHELRASGKLGKQQLEVYRIIQEHGPMTSGEVYQILVTGLSATNPLGAYPQTRPRCTELRSMGMIEEAGRRPCKSTGRLAILWRSTDRIVPLPFERPKRETLTQLRAERDAFKLRVADLEHENRMLRKSAARRRARKRNNLGG